MSEKYRFYHRSLAKVYPVDNIHWDEDGNIDEIVLWDKDGNDIIESNLSYGVLMRSTGLFDKNDVEIFEGDILEWHYSEATLQQCGVYAITWKNGAFRLGLNDGETLFDFIDDLDWFEVVGNIYEKPELLEGGSCNN